MQGISKKVNSHAETYAVIFLGLIWGRILAPSKFKNEQKLPKMVYIIPNFLVLHFGEKFMKIQTKKLKLQMQEKLHDNVNENMYSFTLLCIFSCFQGGQLKQQTYKMAVQFFLDCIKFFQF